MVVIIVALPRGTSSSTLVGVPRGQFAQRNSMILGIISP